jgi:hypothetical protein
MTAQEPEPGDPGYVRVRDFLLYSLSLPERTLRSASGLVGGALRESASLLVPQAFQNSKTYSSMVGQMLDFLAEDVGGVERPKAQAGPPPVEDFVARKAVGNFLDLAGLATLHLSPMLLLAVVSDVAYGSHAYLKELAEDLKRQRVIDEHSTIDHVDDLLKAVAGAAGTTSMAFNTPPLSVAGLHETVQQTREAIAAIEPVKVLPQAEVERLWQEIHQLAACQGSSPLQVSTAMTLYSLNKIGTMGRGALSTVKAAGTLLDRHVLDHYRTALGEIGHRGLYASLAQTGRPYLEAVWNNFSGRRTTITERLLSGQLIALAWGGLRRWLRKGRKPRDAGGQDNDGRQV